MEETIDLREYFAIIKKRFWIIALLAIISALISGVISFFMLNPVYEAKSTLIVNADKQAETQMEYRSRSPSAQPKRPPDLDPQARKPAASPSP